MRLRWATVADVRSERAGVQYLRIVLGPSGPSSGRSHGEGPAEEPAVAYVSLTGPCSPGERVLLNTTGVDLALGTGSLHFVVARAERQAEAVDDPSGGHIMKLRYTPMQHDVLAVEEEGSPGHAALREAASLEGMPVVCCALHSQVPHVAAAVKERDPSLCVAYVMTDHAALPMRLSDLVASCRSTGLLDSTLTAGQAFGGEMEAVNLHSALLAAKHVAGADVAVVAIGPGIVGTGTAFGHGGVAQGEAVNATACLGGRPIAALRISFADPRPRHRPVSHHTLTALARVALAPAEVALPALPDGQAEAVEQALREAGVWRVHRRRTARAGADRLPDTRGIEVRSMGRGVADDPAFFAAAAAAGEVAVLGPET